jgi:hypothetical protein
MSNKRRILETNRYILKKDYDLRGNLLRLELYQKTI